MQKNDAALVRQVLAGDTSAYENLVDTHKGRVFALVVGRIGNFSSAEDVVQNAFVEAYVHLKSLQSPEKFAGWLRGIAVNLSNKWLQRQHTSVPIDTVDNEVSQKSVAALPDEVFEVGQTKEAVLKAVEGLPDIYREAVLLHYMEGMTYPEMATFLEVPESTVTGRLQVARNRLRDDLMPLVGEALQEKRPTSKLTRKVMSALPLMLYAAPTEATLLAKLKGSKMLNMIGFLCAGVIGTGVYFGGITEVIGWRVGEEISQEQVVLEFDKEVEKLDKPVLDKPNDMLEQQNQNQQTQEKPMIEKPKPEVRKTDGGEGNSKKVEKADFKMKSSPQDSLEKITYSIPASVVSDSALVEINMFNRLGEIVAKPVRSVHKPGSYTAYQTKRGLPDGMYFVMIEVDGNRGSTRALKLVWEDRK